MSSKKGYHFDNQKGRWVVRVMDNGRYVYVGSTATEAEAITIRNVYLETGQRTLADRRTYNPLTWSDTQLMDNVAERYSAEESLQRILNSPNYLIARAR